MMLNQIPVVTVPSSMNYFLVLTTADEFHIKRVRTHEAKHQLFKVLLTN